MPTDFDDARDGLAPPGGPALRLGRRSLESPQSLDEVLLYRLGTYLALAAAPIIRICEGEFGISRREWRLVAVLAERGGMLSSELALACGLDRARTSRAISSLAQKKLLHRQAPKADARQVRVSLSTTGLKLHRQLWPKVRHHHQLLMEGLQKVQRVQLENLLDGLYRQAQTLGEHYADLPKANRHRGRRVPFDGD